MKIVIINTSERTGGAAVAAGRLGKALEQAGIQVDKLVRKDTWLNRFRFYWERLIIFLCNHLNRKNLFAVSIANTGMDLSGHPSVKKADIIHLHWINQGFLSVSNLGKLINSGKPIVWTLHDLWPATAICHYPDKCKKYQSKCSQCPLQVTNSLFDLANWTYNRKKQIGLNKIHFIGCSKWITEMAKAAEAAGADALSLINTITGMKIDIHRRKFAIANKTGGMSGPAIKPIAVRMVYQVAQAVQIPIIGMGGIATAEDAIEFILAGASAVSVGAMNFVDPYTTVKVVEGIEDYMRTYHVENLTDLIGAVQ